MKDLFPKLTAKDLLKDLLFDIVGSLLIAVGIYNFAL